MTDHIYQYAHHDPNNKIAQMNQEAAENLNPKKQHRMVQDQAIYGEYNFAPIMDDKKEALEAALNEIHKVVTPTIKNLRHTSNVAEIQERLYRKIAPYENQFNVCIFNSNNTRDTSYCADVFANQLRTDVVEYAKKILRDY